MMLFMKTQIFIREMVQREFSNVGHDEPVLKNMVPIDVAVKLWKLTNRLNILLSPGDFMDKELIYLKDIEDMIYTSYLKESEIKKDE